MKYRQYDEDKVIFSKEFGEHLSAMTTENLHSKSAIALELAARDINIKELEEQLTALGFCAKCMSIPKHDIEEPFSSCKCHTSEDHATAPLQKLQLLEAEHEQE